MTRRLWFLLRSVGPAHARAATADPEEIPSVWAPPHEDDHLTAGSAEEQEGLDRA